MYNVYLVSFTYLDIVNFLKGRLIDHIKDKTTNLERVTFLVFDEADRMFDMGFGKSLILLSNLEKCYISQQMQRSYYYIIQGVAKKK